MTTPHKLTIYDPISQTNRLVEVTIRPVRPGLWDFEVRFGGADAILAGATTYPADREDVVLARAVQAAREALTDDVHTSQAATGKMQP